MSSGPGAGGPGGAGFDAELLQRLAAEVHKLPIRDLLVQTIGTISSLAWGRISGEGKDLAQAQLAIDALRALIPVVAPTLSEQAGRDHHGEDEHGEPRLGAEDLRIHLILGKGKAHGSNDIHALHDRGCHESKISAHCLGGANIGIEAPLQR